VADALNFYRTSGLAVLIFSLEFIRLIRRQLAHIALKIIFSETTF